MTQKPTPLKPDLPPSGRVESVMLMLPTVNRPRHLIPFVYKVGVIEDYIGDEVLVRFAEIVVQVAAEWIVLAEE